MHKKWKQVDPETSHTAAHFNGASYIMPNNLQEIQNFVNKNNFNNTFKSYNFFYRGHYAGITPDFFHKLE